MRAAASAAAVTLFLFASAPAFAEAAAAAPTEAPAHEPGEPDVPHPDDVQKQLQNPIASLVSVPFQENIGFGTGPDDGVQSLLNVQPVVPIPLTPSWNYIVRPIVPFISTPTPPDGDREGVIGDILIETFFSPKASGDLIWGVGPTLNLPTAVPSDLSPHQWGLGPSFVALAQPGKWTLGALIVQVWGIGGDDRGEEDLNQFILQPIVSYSLPDGWTVAFSPTWTANWAAGDDRWTIPLGLTVSKLIKQPRRVPVQWTLGAFANVVHPDSAPDWFLRAQLTLVLPPLWKKPWFD